VQAIEEQRHHLAAPDHLFSDLDLVAAPVEEYKFLCTVVVCCPMKVARSTFPPNSLSFHHGHHAIAAN